MSLPYAGQIALIVLLVTSLGGCATTTGPSVPPYTGADSVTEATPNAFIGSWDLTILNPRDGQETHPTVVNYNGNGDFSGTITPTGQSVAILGDADLIMTGTWSTDNGFLTHHDVQMSSSGDNPLASFMTSLMNGMASNLGGTADIYELSDSHVILVAEDGVATRYDRQ